MPTATNAVKRFAHVPGVAYPEAVPSLKSVAPATPKSGEPAIFDGDEWFYVEATSGARRLWALFPVRAWAEAWIRQMKHPENFVVKQLLYP